MNSIIDLKGIGEEKVLEILEAKANFPDMFDTLLHLFYTRREGYSTKEICEIHDFDYNQLYRLVTKLVHLEIIKTEDENKFILSQKGIDFYKGLSKFDFLHGQIKAIQKKHSIQILKQLNTEDYGWNELYRGTDISQSSMKNVLDALIDAGLVKKGEGKYSITLDGQSILSSIKEFSEMPYTPSFEIQVKFMVQSSDIPLVYNKIRDEIISEEEVRQSDYYIAPIRVQSNTSTYLRYREELPLKHSLKKTPAHILTWARLINKSRYENVLIMNREREEIKVDHPSIVFFLEFLNAKIDKKIVKQRKRIKLGEVTINLDHIEVPKKRGAFFVEIKANAWDYDESKNKAKIINQLMKDMGIEMKSIDKAYYEIL
jgi:adenylate cyclase class IV/predicted transcriptional regulator